MSTPDAAPQLQQVCGECGAALSQGEPCRARFDSLLVLDHSRTEPWGSRHGLAFAVFTLQHSTGASFEMIERCIEMLWRVYVRGEDRLQVVEALRRGQRTPASALPPMRARPDIPNVFAVTIDDMRDFPAATYAADLDAWCRATLDAWFR